MTVAADPRPLAVTAAALFLANLTVVPGLAFVFLAWLWHSRRRSAPALAAQHLRQAFRASLAGGGLLCSTLLIAWWGGVSSPVTWVVVILYFVTMHATLILLGVVALVRALAGQAWRYPLIGGSL